MDADPTPWMHDTVMSGNGVETYKFILTATDGTRTTVIGRSSMIRRLGLYPGHAMPVSKYADTLLQLDGSTLEVIPLSVRNELSRQGIQMLEVATGNITEFPTGRAASSAINVTHKVVYLALDRGPQYSVNGYAFRYTTDTEWGEVNEVSTNAKRSIECWSDGDVIVAQSQRAAERVTGVNAKAIVRSLRGEPIDFNWKFVHA